MTHHHHSVRIAIVGAGRLGSTFAYTLLLSGLATEIVLIDSDKLTTEGEALDLLHSRALTHPAKIWAGDYRDCESASVIVITDSAAMARGETQLDLLKRNLARFREIIPQVTRHNTDGILLVASQPVDVLTYAAYKLSGWAGQRVIGSGTVLSTARLRELLGLHYEVDSRNIHAYVIGESGDRAIPVWSLANITSIQLSDFCFTNGIHHDQKALDDLFRKTRDDSHQIIERKGSIDYGGALSLLRIVEAVLKNQQTILCVSNLIENYYGISDVCLSLPAIIGRQGVERFLRLDLNQQELESLKYSTDLLKTHIAKLVLENR